MAGLSSTFQTAIAIMIIMTTTAVTAASNAQFAFIGTCSKINHVPGRTTPLMFSPSTFMAKQRKMVLQMSDSSEDETNASKTGRRRKRRDGLERAPPSSPEKEEEKEVEMSKAPEVVEMQVMDVRDILSGNTAPATIAKEEAVEDDYDDEDEYEWVEVDDDEEDDDDEYEYVYVDDDDDEEQEESNALSSPKMAKLKAAARRMREAETLKAAEERSSSSSLSGEEESSGFQIPEAVTNALSTIVTIDFFVVLGLLAWFLAGIFCSYILKDDTVQIAFNSNFQAFVQPALGILMIGAAASALGNKEGE